MTRRIDAFDVQAGMILWEAIQQEWVVVRNVAVSWDRMDVELEYAYPSGKEITQRLRADFRLSSCTIDELAADIAMVALS